MFLGLWIFLKLFSEIQRGRQNLKLVLARLRSSSFFGGGRAGHGGSVEDTSGDEVDGMDETLCPVDYQESGMITDDEIFEEVGHVFTIVDDVSSPEGNIVTLT